MTGQTCANGGASGGLMIEGPDMGGRDRQTWHNSSSLNRLSLEETIFSTNLEFAFQASIGNQAFQEALERTKTSADLCGVLGQYTRFNSVFGSCATTLTGRIGVQLDLFRDPDRRNGVNADRADQVASEIYFSTIDEFGGNKRAPRTTHRELAQRFLRTTGRFFGFNDSDLDRVAAPTKFAIESVREVIRGYGVNCVSDIRHLFKAIGFHVGSEGLADHEFRILDHYLHCFHPELVLYLERSTFGLSHNCSAYSWVQVHTSVEADHLAAALRAADNAVRLYTGAESRTMVQRWIYDGLEGFFTVQNEFMKHLLDSSADFFEARPEGEAA